MEKGHGSVLKNFASWLQDASEIDQAIFTSYSRQHGGFTLRIRWLCCQTVGSKSGLKESLNIGVVA